MLPRKQRIPSYELAVVMRQGNRILDAHIHLFILHNTINQSRFSFIVPAKVEKLATGRNRIRRLLSESVRKSYPQIQPGWDCVMLVKQKMPELIQSKTDSLVIALLQKAGVFGI